MKKIVITGCAGFIGSHLLDEILKNKNHIVLGIDSLSYASIDSYSINMKFALSNDNFTFLRNEIQSKECIDALCTFKPDVIFNLAAETHVDNSIKNSKPFINSNVLGTINLLDYVKESGCKYIHVSTDEVYGHLSLNDDPFNESSNLNPRSPYAASKAASDLLVNSYYQTFSIDSIITRCTNNFGTRQHLEKFMPTVIHSCKHKKPIPLYGTGKNVRDWIHVNDHIKALIFLMDNGNRGEIYNISSHNEFSNIDIVSMILDILQLDNKIEFIKDRPAHDFRYALDTKKINSIGWNPNSDFHEMLKITVESLYHQL